jgi:hypothetical protein
MKVEAPTAHPDFTGRTEVVFGFMREYRWYDIVRDTLRFRWDALIDGELITIRNPPAVRDILGHNDEKIEEARLNAKKQFLNYKKGETI